MITMSCDYCKDKIENVGYTLATVAADAPNEASYARTLHFHWECVGLYVVGDMFESMDVSIRLVLEALGDATKVMDAQLRPDVAEAVYSLGNRVKSRAELIAARARAVDADLAAKRQARRG